MENIKKNYVLQLSYQILNMVLPFVTSPYIARILGASQLGIYSYTYSVTSIFILAINLGIEKYGSRTIATVRTNQEKLNQTFSELFTLHFILGMVVSIFFLGSVFLFCEYKPFFLLQTFLIVGTILDINWFFFGIEKFKVTVTRNFILKVITVVSVFMLVRERGDLWKYVLIMSLGTAISQSAIWIVCPRYVKFTKIKVGDIRCHIKPLLVLFVAVLAESAYTYIDKIMIGTLGDMEQLGFCENAYKVISFPMGMITSLGVVMLPRMAVLFKDNKKNQIHQYISKSMQFVLILAIGMCGGMIAIGKPFAILFWGKDFATSGNVITIIAPIVIFMSWSDVIRNQFLIPRKMDKEYTIALVVGAFANITCNALLIPAYGAFGAAIGTVVSYLSISMYQTFVTRKMLPYRSFIKTSIPCIFFSMIMVLTIKMIQKFMGNSVGVFSLIIQVMIGIIVYVGLVVGYWIVCKDEVVANGIERMKARKLQDGDHIK